MINIVGKLTGRITESKKLQGKLHGGNTERKHIQGNMNSGTIKIYPGLEDLEVNPSAIDQSFKSDKYGFDNVKVNAVKIIEHYLEGTNLILVLPDSSKLTLDVSSYIDGGLTQEQIEAINNMTVSLEDNILVIDYDETILDFIFSIDETDLIIENNTSDIDFNINENEELVVMY